MTEEDLTQFKASYSPVAAFLREVPEATNLVKAAPISALWFNSGAYDLLRASLAYAEAEGLNTTKTLRLLGVPRAAMRLPWQVADSFMVEVLKRLDASTFAQAVPEEHERAKEWAKIMRSFGAMGPEESVERWFAFHALAVSDEVGPRRIGDVAQYLASLEHIDSGTLPGTVITKAEKWERENRRIVLSVDRDRYLNWREQAISRLHRQRPQSVAEHVRQYMNFDIETRDQDLRGNNAVIIQDDIVRDRMLAWLGMDYGRDVGTRPVFPVESIVQPGGRNGIAYAIDADLEAIGTYHGGYHIHILRTEREFVEEGGFHNHCVGDPRHGFWQKACEGRTMILSVRDGAGNRRVTVELAPDLDIVQCRRGKHEYGGSEREAVVEFVRRLRTIPEDRRTTSVPAMSATEAAVRRQIAEQWRDIERHALMYGAGARRTAQIAAEFSDAVGSEAWMDADGGHVTEVTLPNGQVVRRAIPAAELRRIGAPPPPGLPPIPWQSIDGRRGYLLQEGSVTGRWEHRGPVGPTGPPGNPYRETPL